MKKISYSHINPDKTNGQSFTYVEGDRIEAEYREQIVPDYQGNPFIEALPDILTEAEFVEKAKHLPDPPNHEQIRRLGYEHRQHMLPTMYSFFLPTTRNLSLEQNIAGMIRTGYRHRNPANLSFWSNGKEKVDTLSGGDYVPQKQYQQKQIKSLSYTLLGISGIGKTVAIEAVLATLPHIIAHDFGIQQIVYLKFECPHDGSIKGFCLNFFLGIDNLLGCNYYKNRAKEGRATVDQMIPQIAQVAWIHGIGILVVDEIQRLSVAKSGGAERMLNFFTQLINTIGVPVMLIGTPKAEGYIHSDFSHIRRGIGPGDTYWKNLDPDDEWELFLKALWRYQYTVTRTPLSAELSEAMYYESVGIPDLAIKLYSMAQTRAMRLGGNEIITPALIHSVAKDNFGQAKPMLEALRNKDYNALLSHPDLRLPEPDPFMHAAKPAVIQPSKAKPRNTKPKKTQPRRPKSEPPPGSLMQIVRDAKPQNIEAHTALREAGIIKPVTEFLNPSS